jgi:hypothetical protein
LVLLTLEVAIAANPDRTVPSHSRNLWLPHTNMQAFLHYYGEASEADASDPTNIVVELSWFDPDHPYVYTVWARGSDHGPRVEQIAVSIKPAEEGLAEVTPAVLNRVPMSIMTRGVQEAMGWDLQAWAAEHVKVTLPAKGEPYPDEHYKMVANAYRIAEQAGRAPAEFIAEYWQTTLASANRWIRKARDRGYLPPPDKRRGGRPRKNVPADPPR